MVRIMVRIMVNVQYWLKIYDINDIKWYKYKYTERLKEKKLSELVAISIFGHPDREIQSLGSFSGANWASSASAKDPPWIHGKNGEKWWNIISKSCLFKSV